MRARCTIISAPAGAGKSRALMGRVAESLSGGNAQSVLMLVPTAADARAAVSHLLEKVEGIFPVPVANFYEFVARILEHNQRSGREISPAERNLLIQHIIDNLASRGEIRYFRPLLGFKGLAPALGNFIKELKQNTILPEQFLHSTERDSSRKGAEIGAIYCEYQRILKDANLYDTEGRLWRVRDLIKAGKMAPYEKVEEVFIDNFANFTPSEFDIIKALAERVKSITFALTCEEGERRGELFDTTSITIAHIEKELTDARRAPMDATSEAANSLAILRENLFDPLAERTPAKDEMIRIIRCPNRTAEVVETGRRVKSLLLEGRRADDIVVIARSLTNYAALYEEIFREQGIPFSIAGRKRLAETTVVRSIMHLLEIPAEEFSRHSIMRFLGSPIARAIIGEFDPSILDRVSLEAQITTGIDSWRSRIDTHIRGLEGETASTGFDDDLPLEPKMLERRLADAKRARDFVEHLFTQLEALRADTTIAGYIDRVLALTEIQALRDACVDAALPEKTSEDIAALAVFREELRHLLSIEEILGSADSVAPYSKFLEYLHRLLDSTIESSLGKPEGRVRIMEAPETRGLFFPIVFICGLVEKEFPRQIPQSPFYNDRARREMNRGGDIFLSEHAAGQKFEMFLFYTAATRATERLYLTHPLVDTEGREAMPSYYVSEVERLFDKLPTERISSAEVLPSHEDAVCPREMLAAALADGVAAKNPAAFVPQSLRKLANREMPSLEPLALALKVTHERESERPYGKFDGVISDREIQKRLEASMRGAVLSASRLSLYGTCPFRYFTQRVLGLEEIIEPEDELTSVNRGKFFHSVLRDFFMQLRDGGSTVILKRNCETAAKLLEQIANVHFEWIRRNGEVANEVVFQAEQGEILDILRAFVAKEAETNEENLSTPTRFEMAFGFEKPLSIWDPASTTNPLVISGGPFPIRVRGVIDRLDRTADGWVVIDYKSGSSAPSKSKFVDGSDLQLPLYAIAVNELFSDGATKIVDGFYYRLRDGSHPGRLQYGNPKPPELYEIVKKHAVAHVANICAGRFPPSPRDDNACNSCAACGVCGYSETRTERKSTNDDGPD